MWVPLLLRTVLPMRKVRLERGVPHPGRPARGQGRPGPQLLGKAFPKVVSGVGRRGPGEPVALGPPQRRPLLEG